MLYHLPSVLPLMVASLCHDAYRQDKQAALTPEGRFVLRKFSREDE